MRLHVSRAVIAITVLMGLFVLKLVVRLVTRGATHHPRLAILVYMTRSDLRVYYNALGTVQCYAKRERIYMRILYHENFTKYCDQTTIYQRKHCAVATYLDMNRDLHWAYVLDADTGVVNPHHSLYEYIDDRVRLILTERFHNWEISSGNYIVKNSRFARDFLRALSTYETRLPRFGQFDGALQLHLLKILAPDAEAETRICKKLWLTSKHWTDYMDFITCVRLVLGVQRLWLEKIKILHRAEGWVLDQIATDGQWCKRMFMVHGWKKMDMDEHNWALRATPYGQQCNTRNAAEWSYNKKLMATCDQVKGTLLKKESVFASHFKRTATFYQHSGISECWPYCGGKKDPIEIMRMRWRV